MKIWILNTLLYLFWCFGQTNPFLKSIYDEFVQNGAQMYNCMEITGTGMVPSTECPLPMPDFSR